MYVIKCRTLVLFGSFKLPIINTLPVWYNLTVRRFAKLKVKASYIFIKNISISLPKDRLTATSAAIPRHAPETIKHINMNRDKLLEHIANLSEATVM